MADLWKKEHGTKNGISEEDDFVIRFAGQKCKIKLFVYSLTVKLDYCPTASNPNSRYVRL